MTPRTALLLAVAAATVLPALPAAAGQAARATCTTGTWKMSGYQQKSTSAVYGTSLLTKGGGGTRLKISSAGLAWDFGRAAKVVTSGRNNGVAIAESALYRKALRHKVVAKGGKFTTKLGSVQGAALVKTVTTRPEPSKRLEKVAGLVRAGNVTVVPTGRVAYACSAHALHFRRTTKLDGSGGREVTDWRFTR
ncbi:hypothetical protein GCM10027589_10440 [Actinocorallia lasiicapitis]